MKIARAFVCPKGKRTSFHLIFSLQSRIIVRDIILLKILGVLLVMRMFPRREGNRLDKIFVCFLG